MYNFSALYFEYPKKRGLPIGYPLLFNDNKTSNDLKYNNFLLTKYNPY